MGNDLAHVAPPSMDRKLRNGFWHRGEKEDKGKLEQERRNKKMIACDKMKNVREGMREGGRERVCEKVREIERAYEKVREIERECD